jgi:hypothetical protein
MLGQSKYINNYSTGQRREIRFSTPVEKVRNRSSVEGFQTVVYPFPYVTTVYFGVLDKKQNIFKLFRNLKIRARFYSKRPQGNFFMIPDNQMCVFEVKTDKRLGNISTKSKARWGEVSNESVIKDGLTFEQIVEALSNPDRLSEITANLDCTALRLVLEAFTIRKLEQLRPLAATNYRRIHYLSNTERATRDQNIKFYLTVQDDIGKNNNIFYLVRETKKEIVEIKKHLDTDLSSKLVINLRKSGHSITKIKDGKGTTLRRILKDTDRRKVYFPSTVAAGSKEWNWAENEVKIDLKNKDPRKFIEEFNPKGSWLIGNMKREVKFIKFYLTPDEKTSICIMTKSLKPKSKSKLKVKKFISKRGGSLVRDERVSVYSPKALVNVLSSMHLVMDKTKISPMIYEYRVYKYLFNVVTGNIFRVYADHCVVPTHDFVPLDQIEVESMGTITPLGKNTKSSISADQIYLSTKILKTLGKQVLDFPGTTKSLWIKKQIGIGK